MLWALAVALAISAPGVDPVSAQEAASGTDLREITIGDVPYYVTMVLGAAVQQMRGHDDPAETWPVTFAPEAAAVLQEPEFRYEGFSLAALALTAYDEATAEPGVLRLRAVLRFVDDVGRRAATSLMADYALTDEDLVVRRALVVPVSPPQPEAKLFFVPAAGFPEEALQSGGNGLELLAEVVERSVGGPASSDAPRGVAEYYVFAFLADRLPPDATIQLRLSETAEGIEGFPASTLDLDYQGWRVAVIRARFALNAGEEFFVKAVYRPGSGTAEEERTPRLIGALSSYVRQAGMPDTTAAPAEPQALDPAPDEIPRSARERLAELDELLELDLVTPDEHAEKRRQILDDL